MARSGSHKRSYTTSRNTSDVADDEIIMKQLLADMEQQSTSGQTSPPNSGKTLKSRDVDNATADFTVEIDNPKRKKRKRKSHIDQEDKRVSIGVSDIDEELLLSTVSKIEALSQSFKNGYHSNGVQMEQQKATAPAQPQGKELSEIERKKIRREEKKKQKRDSRQFVDSGRLSLGPNSAALMESILKGCTPTTIKEFKQEIISVSEPNVETSPVVRKVARAFDDVPPKVAQFLPEGYKPGPEGEKKRFHCPVDDCAKHYTRMAGLGEHMKTAHAGQILNDNRNGTLTVITREDYQEAILMMDEDAPKIKQSIPILPPTKRPLHSKLGDPASHKIASGVEADHVTSAGAISNGKSGVTNGSKKAEKPPTRNSTNAVKSTPVKHSPNSDTSYKEPSAKKTLQRTSMESHQKPTVAKSLGRSKSVDPRTKFQDWRSTSSGFRSKSEGPRTILPSDVRREDSEEVMEDWEIDPGLIQVNIQPNKAHSDTEGGMAFSSCYIHSTPGGINLAGAHFQICHVAPGKFLTPDPVPYPRICSVASGKLEVQIGANRFCIGQHGMWRVRAGQKCTATNRRYVDAVIHMSTFSIG